MERPASAASSAATATATATAIAHTSHTATFHTSATSTSTSSSTHNVPESRSSCSTTITSLFLKNCRLLDLDLLPDWPSVTPASLGNDDASTRIRCAEWCLYQLFRTYDSATTVDKLQPFFPPLEPLQSINLRAALYRCLNELKKNGLLGRHVLLRKSMLDDCQADKFWELCLAFSAIVLRKIRVERKNKHAKPIAERTATAEALNKSQRDSMLPLAIAHRAALTKVLAQKDKKRQTYARLYDVLIDKEADLHVRGIHAQHQADKKRPRPSTMAQDVLDKRWVGSNAVRDALLDGRGAPGADNLLIISFDQVWEANDADRLFKREASDTGILEDVEARTRHQKRRLVKWQTFHEKLLSSKPKPTKEEVATKQHQLRFDRHQNLTLRDISDNPRSPSSPSRHARSESVAKYDEILTAMREELRKRSVTDPVSPTKPAERVRRPPNRRPNNSVDAMIRSASPEPHQKSMSQTAVPLRPMFGKRVSSRSRSYHQPKVINQREPIPLKSEIFSPLKTERRSSATPSPRGSILASPIEDPLLESGIDHVIGGAVQRMRQNSDSTDTGLGTISPSRSTSSTNSPRVSWKSQISENADSAVEIPSRLSAATRNLDSVGRTVRPSLADRTRMSMAFKSTEDTLSLRTEAETIDKDTVRDNFEPVESADLPQRRPTLQERTRQSISLAPGPSPAPRKAPSHARSRTSQYPVNQFETPEKSLPRRSTMSLAVNVEAGAVENDSMVKRNITPREKLFDQDAEYASIFKARPKVARSPDLTPQIDSGHGSMETEEGEEDAVGVGSPLVGR
ncbi:uncharacterized protein MYCFIDRAFT_81088 [Pseudocercospora fijiensis CIRAD86]|uniref:HAUS augmin-like complex subunit 6 N-terminal domain-containing protein n=1 Tax=Pseudocercospora fijiensis (strain CIRAD86) TaxID=383855 RepID=M3AQ82_PSEFD|nr:uncharacterized protein MYCFIDRAFT_81088 [Pseudocercospora fijiensis CIRAD86]EME79602.1 hypothetical protein MYCFIDRAFT_81088 [Pseudocercospora fijiensis CIRAD86]